jgi:hypothetical protein
LDIFVDIVIVLYILPPYFNDFLWENDYDFLVLCGSHGANKFVNTEEF